MVEFVDLEEVAGELRFLASREEPLASNLGRRPGQKEERWACLFLGPGDEAGPTAGAVPATDERTSAPICVGEHPIPAPPDESTVDVRSELAALRREVSDLRHQLQALRERLGD
jgi:uncharacterized protein YceH (UPF0502 family)